MTILMPGPSNERKHVRRPRRAVRVLIVCDHLAYGEAIHGAGRMMIEMTMGFSPDAVRVTSCVLRDGGPLGEKLHERGVPLHFLAAHRYSPLPLVTLRRIIREQKIDVIHVTDYQAATLGRLAAKLAGIPAIVHVRSHHSEFQRVPYPWYMEQVNRKLASGTARAIANSESLRQFAIERMGFHPEQVVTIHNPVSRFTMPEVTREQVAKLRQEYAIPEGTPVIGSVTRFYTSKGICYLINAFAKVRAAIPEARLLLVGDGPLAPELRRQASALELGDSVIFAGFRADAAAHLPLFTIAAVPSLEEGIGNVAIEAIASGVPVIASRTGGLPEVVSEGKSGLLVVPADSAQLAAQLLRVLQSPDLLEKLRVGCRAEAARFSLDNYTTRLEQVYREVTGLT
jgi:glycosyltransferase involved in cell wall biosynthesis